MVRGTACACHVAGGPAVPVRRLRTAAAARTTRPPRARPPRWRDSSRPPARPPTPVRIVLLLLAEPCPCALCIRTPSARAHMCALAMGCSRHGGPSWGRLLTQAKAIAQLISPCFLSFEKKVQMTVTGRAAHLSRRPATARGAARFCFVFGSEAQCAWPLSLCRRRVRRQDVDLHLCGASGRLRGHVLPAGAVTAGR